MHDETLVELDQSSQLISSAAQPEKYKNLVNLRNNYTRNTF